MEEGESRVDVKRDHERGGGSGDMNKPKRSAHQPTHQMPASILVRQ